MKLLTALITTILTAGVLVGTAVPVSAAVPACSSGRTRPKAFAGGGGLVAGLASERPAGRSSRRVPPTPGAAVGRTHEHILPATVETAQDGTESPKECS